MRYRRIIWLLALFLATMVCRAQTSINLTENSDGTWTLDQMPAYNVKLIVEYEDDLSQAIDLTDNGDGTWTLDQMPAYNVKLVVVYEDDLSQAIDLTDNGDGTWTLDQMPNYNVKLVVEYEDENVTDVNGDGSITMADANAVVNYFLADDKSGITNFNVDAADVNGDKAITMADANQIVNIFLAQ